MFGYATDETEEAMPMSHLLATKIGYKLTEVRMVTAAASAVKKGRSAAVF